MDAPKESMGESPEDKGGIARAAEAVSKVAGKLIGKRKSPLELLAEHFNIHDSEMFVSSMTELSKTTSRAPDREKFKIWGLEVVYDTHQIHLDEEAAKAFPLANLETTPAYGTMIIALGENYLQSILSEINLRAPAKVYCLSQRVKFEEPLYPGEKLIWEIDSVNRDNGLGLVTRGKTEGGKEVAILTAAFGTERRAATIAELEAVLSGFSSFYEFQITRKTASDFYECLNIPDLREVRDSYPAAFGISALLKLSMAKAGKLDGIYRSMDVDFFTRPLLGNYRIFLMPSSVKGNEKKGYVSQTQVIGVHRESNRLVYSGKITGISQTSPA